MITDKTTGLVYDTKTDENVIDSMLEVNAQIKSLEVVKKKLRDMIIERDLSGVEHNNSVVKIINTQRRTYDKSIMRRVFDADLYDTLMIPDNKAIKKYISENLDTLGNASTELSKNMVEQGKPYTTVRIEKILRDNG